MSARARTRLVNSALSRHPVANETFINYKNILEFKNSIVDALAKEELEYEAELLGDCEVVQIDEVYSGCYGCLMKSYAITSQLFVSNFF